MQEYLKKAIKTHPRKFIDSRELETQIFSLMGRFSWECAGDYDSFAYEVGKLVDAGVLKPVKTSGHNGRVPPLAAKYRLEKTNTANSPDIFSFQSAIDLSYFHSHPGDFFHYQEILKSIDRYLVENSGRPPEMWDTVNERSLALTGDEKFLLSSEGARLLSRVNVTLDDLHCYKVAEPFFYRQLTGNTGSAEVIYGLIIENKDTFETMSRLQERGYLRLSPPPDLIIYGEGNKITKSWLFLESIPWLCGKTVQLFYFGDLDPAGINIYCRLLSAVDKHLGGQGGTSVKVALRLEPAGSLYSLLLEQGITRALGEKITASDISNLNYACENFPPALREGIIKLWGADRMVPQEALSASRMVQIGEVEL